MKLIKSYSVSPSLPPRMKALHKIVHNLWWSWNPEATELLRRMDRNLWRGTSHNPLKMLGQISQKRIQELLKNESFLEHLDRVEKDLDEYMTEKTWYSKQDYKIKDFKIAYYSAEFGIHECLPIYSGGLGILAGDHLKSASEIGIPLIGIGLLYRFGYFSQYLDVSGWQKEKYLENDFYNMPLTLETTKEGKPLIISVDFPERIVYAQIWKAQVGRVPLYLLDTNIETNSAEDKDITSWLYGGDKEMRIKQELLLGFGGTRILNALDIKPTIYHINEGHAAFLILERTEKLMKEENLSFDVALEIVKASNVFTTHTPVPAGNDRFHPDVILLYLKNYLNTIGLDKDKFLGLGRENIKNQNEDFCMTVLALKASAYSNGVSQLHGEVSRNMWKNLWPNLPTEDIPISHITNGVHIRTWISEEMLRLYDRYLGVRWKEDPVDQSIWERVANISNEEVWRAHVRMKETFVGYIRTKLKDQLINRGVPFSEISSVANVLNPNALTIGFARRFATYKRALLLFKDIDRMTKILTNPQRPVQLIFAGKAHPHDNPGKELIKQIVELSKRKELRNHIVFLENYDIRVARYLVQGVDIWLNTPKRPQEASGTSGMKVCPNGGINLSILDGWWCEAYETDNGWAIGTSEQYDDPNAQDDFDAAAIYHLLEEEIIPLYYKNATNSIPNEWISKMKRSMASISPRFNSNRMVKDYLERSYLPGGKRSADLNQDNYKEAKQLVKWKEHIRTHWDNIKITNIATSETEKLQVGSEINITVNIHLSDIAPEDVCIEICHGALNGDQEFIDKQIVRLNYQENQKNNNHQFQGTIPCKETGRNGLTVRVLPLCKNLLTPYELNLVTWA